MEESTSRCHIALIRHRVEQISSDHTIRRLPQEVWRTHHKKPPFSYGKSGLTGLLAGVANWRKDCQCVHPHVAPHIGVLSLFPDFPGDRPARVLPETIGSHIRVDVGVK